MQLLISLMVIGLALVGIVTLSNNSNESIAQCVLYNHTGDSEFNKTNGCNSFEEAKQAGYSLESVIKDRLGNDTNVIINEGAK